MESLDTETAVFTPGTHKKYVCDLCNFSTHYRSSLSRHRRGFHKLGKIFECPICGKKYRRGEYLKCHQKVAHTGKVTADPTPCTSTKQIEAKENSATADTPKCQALPELTDSQVSVFFAEMGELDLQTVEVSTSTDTTLDLLDLLE